MYASAGGTVTCALSRSRATAPATTVSSPSSTNGTRPSLTAPTTDSLRSTPITRLPAWASTAAVGRPMYPRPMTLTESSGLVAIMGCSSGGSAVSGKGSGVGERSAGSGAACSPPCQSSCEMLAELRGSHRAVTLLLPLVQSQPALAARLLLARRGGTEGCAERLEMGVQVVGIARALRVVDEVVHRAPPVQSGHVEALGECVEELLRIPARPHRGEVVLLRGGEAAMDVGRRRLDVGEGPREVRGQAECGVPASGAPDEHDVLGARTAFRPRDHLEDVVHRVPAGAAEIPAEQHRLGPVHPKGRIGEGDVRREELLEGLHPLETRVEVLVL